jgi:uncharacterized membrane protein
MLIRAFLIGAFAGLRSLTPPAAAAWSTYIGALKLRRPLSLIGSPLAVALLTLLALAELVADKLPQAPNRTAPPGLIARIAGGALSGACIASNARAGIFLGALLGAAGGVGGWRV